MLRIAPVALMVLACQLNPKIGDFGSSDGAVDRDGGSIFIDGGALDGSAFDAASPDACVPVWIQLLADPSFELHNGSWIEVAEFSLIVQDPSPYEGSYVAWLAGSDSVQRIIQRVTIPSDATDLRASAYLRGSTSFLEPVFGRLRVALLKTTGPVLLEDFALLDINSLENSWAHYVFPADTAHAAETGIFGFGFESRGGWAEVDIDQVALEALVCR